MVEDASPRCAIALEGADLLVGFDGQLGGVIVDTHQLGAVIGRHVLACFGPRIEHLLAEIERPVEAGRIVVDELRIRHDLADTVDHFGNLFDVRLLGLDPQQVGAVLQAGDAVEHHAVHARAGAELEEVRRQALGRKQLAVAADEHLPVADVGRIDFIGIEEAVVLVAEIACFLGESDLLGETGPERIGAGDDDAVLDTHL